MGALSHPTGQAFFQSVFGAPFSEPRFSIGPPNAAATFQTPFQQPLPTPNSFPLFEALVPTHQPRFIPYHPICGPP